MRDCKEIEELLTPYIDGFLSSEEKAQLEEHLKQCPQCQLELEELQNTVNLLEDLGDEELIPPAAFRRELRQKLERIAKEESPSRKNNKFSLSKLQAWMPLAAAAILLLVFTPFALNFGFGNMGMKSSAPTEMALDGGYYSREMANADIAMSKENRVGFYDAAKIEEAGMAVMEEQGTVPPGETIEQKIIKTGYLQLDVDSYRAATQAARGMVEGWGGYVINENTYTFGPNQSLLAGSISLRIPQQAFEEALNNLEGLGNVRNRSASGQDVTEEFVDIQSRLRAMRLKEDRLLELLGKSGSLGDVLAVENELARTRADLEALEGRLRYLSNRTDYSTINIDLRETLTPSKQITTTGFKGVIDRAVEAFIRSINSIIISLGNFIVFLVGRLPYIVIILGFIGTGWLVYRKYRKR